MNQKLLKRAEAFGIDTKGKTESQVMAEIEYAWNNEKAEIEQNNKQQSIDNGVKLLPNIKKQFEKPFEIWLEKLQNGKKPECVQVVGFNPNTSEIIVCKGTKSDDGIKYKLYQVSEKIVITTTAKLDELNAKVKEERKKTTKSGGKKKSS